MINTKSTDENSEPGLFLTKTFSLLPVDIIEVLTRSTYQKTRTQQVVVGILTNFSKIAASLVFSQLN